MESVIAKEEAKEAIQYELENFYYAVSKDRFEQHSALTRQLTEINHKIDALQESFFIRREMDRETFDKFNIRYQKERSNIEVQLAECVSSPYFRSVWDLSFNRKAFSSNETEGFSL